MIERLIDNPMPMPPDTVASPAGQPERVSRVLSSILRSAVDPTRHPRASYAVNVEMDDLDSTLGVAQTRPHEPPQVMKDMEECDERADDTRAISGFASGWNPHCRSASSRIYVAADGA
jgi:hypothetical protein